MVLDYVDGRWNTARAENLRPGIVLLVAAKVGGYDPALGFTGDKPKKGQESLDIGAILEPIIPAVSIQSEMQEGSESTSVGTAAAEWKTIYIMTCTVLAWLPAFAQPAFANLVLDSWRFLQRERNIGILAYGILENHLHWIAFGPDLARRVNEFKSFTAKSILQEMRRRNFTTPLQEHAFYKHPSRTDQNHQFWVEGSHPQQIQSDEVMWQKIEYIHNNPLRRGYVDDPLAWRYSSARNYAGQTG